MIILALALACAEMTAFQMSGVNVTITKAEKVSDNLPPRCRVDGVIDQRTGAGGMPYGIGFAVALPDNWNGRFLFQGGGGLNGNVANPVGAQAAGDASALSRGFAIVTTDTGHKGTGGFDAGFMSDQQAALDFYYVAIGRVAPLAKEIIARYYGRAADHSYYVGCSTGGREAMIMSQRYPLYFDGIVSGDPAIRTGHSNLGLAYFAATLNGIEPKLSDADKKLVLDSIVNSCDEKDGLKDGMIFNSAACNFSPSSLTCTGAKTDSCLTGSQAAGIQKAFAGPRDSRANPIYPAFPYDWSRLFLVPGILHCQGGANTVDSFDMLSAIVNWVENGKAPDAVGAKSRTQPSRARPLCAYPSYAQYSGQGDPQGAPIFVCR